MTVRIGILGAAAIAPSALVQPANELDGVEVAAVAARDRQRAEAFAAEHHIERVEPDYRSLCHATDIDVIYVALPASHHHQWTIEALNAGKHVLCEKPIALNTGQATEMVRAAERADRLLVEAFHWRYHPLAARMKELVDTRLGSLLSLSAQFTVPIPDTSDIRYQLDLGGGSLMDLGCYPLQWVRFLAGSEPTVTGAAAVEGPSGVDVSMSAQLRFDDRDRLTAEIACSMAADTHFAATVTAVGTDGSLAVTNPLAPQAGNRLELTTAEGLQAETIESASTYHHQLLAFRDAVRSHSDTQPLPTGGADSISLPTGGADSISTMAAIDACYRAAGMQPRGYGL
jgi:predicted dehydrogenase